MGSLEVLRDTSWLGERPYLVEAARKPQLVELVTAGGFRVVEVTWSPDARAAEILAGLGRALDFPEPSPRGWWSFNDYYSEIDRLELGPVAVLVNDADSLAQASLREFTGVVYRLLSIADDDGPWDDPAPRVQYFFLGEWGSQA